MPENRKILLLGVGGHGKSVLDSLITMDCYDNIAFVDRIQEYTTFQNIYKDLNEASDKNCNLMKNKDNGNILMKYPVVGEDKDLERLLSEGYTEAFVAVGSIGDVTVRRKLYELIKKIGFKIPNIIDKSSVVSPYTSLGEGIFIGKNAVVNVETRIGNCAIINSSCVIEHECCIGDFAHIASGSILSGNVQIGAGTHIGAGSVIRQGIQIGAESMIGVGSVVVKNLSDRIVAYGNPCREVV
jgi:sugar O-acyltransferase (sialic acid O-acetyltransferase NeuD family)